MFFAVVLLCRQPGEGDACSAKHCGLHSTEVLDSNSKPLVIFVAVGGHNAGLCLVPWCVWCELTGVLLQVGFYTVSCNDMHC